MGINSKLINGEQLFAPRLIFITAIIEELCILNEVNHE